LVIPPTPTANKKKKEIPKNCWITQKRIKKNAARRLFTLTQHRKEKKRKKSALEGKGKKKKKGKSRESGGEKVEIFSFH